MKRRLLLSILILCFVTVVKAQCTLTGTPNVNSSTITCSTFSGCTTIYIGDGTNPTNLVMNQNLNLSCYGVIQFVIRNNANIDFSNGNYDMTLAAGSSIVIENGGNISAGSNCSASDLIKIGSIKVASCNGSGGAITDFPTLVNDGGFNVVIASATAVCGSGTSTITASQNPAPTSSTTFKFYTVASGGTPVYTTTASSSPYTVTYTTPTISASTTYYVEAVTVSSGATTPRKAVAITVNPLPAAPTVSTTQPTCTVATGTITISNPTGSGMTYSINGTTYTNTTGIFSGLNAGTYNVTAKSAAGCISSATSAVINAQPFVPAQPTLGSLAQPTCTIATGTFSITNYNASYTYTASPSTGVTISGSSVTAPAGTYTITATSGSCSSVASNSIVISSQPTNTWNGSVWSNGAPTSAQKLVFSGNYSSTGNVSGCTCQVTSGSVTFNSGHTLSIVNEVSVNPGGSLIFENNASLVQTNNASVNSGNITYKRNSTPMKLYDYSYWSSPVSGATLSQVPGDSYFYSFNPTANTYVAQTASTVMAAGVGYLSRTPENLTYSPSLILPAIFHGVPNNGVISTPIIKSAGTNNLIGNPYPSAIDIDLFITDPSNSAIVNGTIYLWTHNTAIVSGNYSANDYAKYNLTGGVGTGFGTAALSGGAVPTGKVAAGQGFFIEANTSAANGTYSAVFKNSMRIAGNNSQFFRTNSPSENNEGGLVSQGLEKHRLWISLTNDEGAYNQMLLGYIENATDGMDRLFDGKTTPVGNPVAIYTQVDTIDLSIQGKALPFSSNDIVPLGYSTTINGNLTISLENFDGLFDNQEVYLLDKNTGLYHNLKNANYTFNTSAGTFNDRFELRYSTEALGVNHPVVSESDVKVVSNANGISVYCSAAAITKVEMFDVLGKIVYRNEALQTNALESVSIQNNGMLLVKVTLDNGLTYTKKTLIQ
ncbi:Ig-like domain-containing protein [Flavobacterium sedimenticola]|uniref:T9SS sorting signal type C domain-containing protein n=1 Tax=Flavobacterium sedimenticola TaxID=3043286 RepID=A0ABT6XNR3_9FLAO|nr:T9SS sorting signal type C domain-containing protein [Flavobacterium sedimenticola]MDI9256718.1 T9SS sorting signal type C domain-containing protein [Flavobacterium sedimenticola]